MSDELKEMNALLRSAGANVKIVKVVGRVAGIPVCVDPDHPADVASLYSNHVKVAEIHGLGGGGNT